MIMQLGLTSIFRFLDAAPSDTLVLATIIKTTGASYRKAGAMMLIDEQLRSSGLISGGCLEDDLKAHARSVFETGNAKTVLYDLSTGDDATLWGLGLGCGGEITILMERISPTNHYGGLAALRTHWQNGVSCGLVKIVAHADDEQVGHFAVCLPGQRVASEFGMGRFEMSDRAVTAATSVAQILATPVSPANRLLVCGGGPDAIPLVHFASQLFWSVTVADHRPAYLTAENFPGAESLMCSEPASTPRSVFEHLHGAVIMTHNVTRDVEWLKILVELDLPYLGILGPVARRDALLELSGIDQKTRLYGPAGLDLGAVLPEEIALSIMSEIHAVINGRPGSSLALMRNST
ncbi:MAG: XdhC family protein [Gammaproteobacteria bacterium]|nr:XdhC family protein [Gammaproteobacteria bacterium]